jgi:integrase/recombinase XerD
VARIPDDEIERLKRETDLAALVRGSGVDPASEIELPRVNKRLPRHILTASEADQVINQTDPADTLGVRDRAILETLYSTGLRRSEMVRLSIYDVHLERATVMVRQGKWHKDRLVPIGQRALAWLNKYLAEVRPMLAPVGEETLFVTNAGEPFTPESMSQLARGYIERAQLPGGKQGACHIFRHTMATLMLEGGADIRYIQAILGHSHLSTTQVYTQVGIRMLQQVHAATHPAGLLKPPGGNGNADKATASQAHNTDPPEAHNHAYPPLPPSLRDGDLPADPSALGEALIGEDEDDDG